jgi:SNF2 family DNA or RNA helicase
MVDIQAPSEGRGDAVDPDTPEIENYGSKPWKVMQYCRQVLDKDSAARILIFSSYDESLKVMSDALQQKHIHSLSCGFSGEKVADTIDRFKAPGCRERVLLMNSNDSAAGTNLQLASYVLFLEPAGIHVSHAVAIETQAIGRTVRLGQTRHVKVRIYP